MGEFKRVAMAAGLEDLTTAADVKQGGVYAGDKNPVMVAAAWRSFFSREKRLRTCL